MRPHSPNCSGILFNLVKVTFTIVLMSNDVLSYIHSPGPNLKIIMVVEIILILAVIAFECSCSMHEFGGT